MKTSKNLDRKVSLHTCMKKMMYIQNHKIAGMTISTGAIMIEFFGIPISYVFGIRGGGRLRRFAGSFDPSVSRGLHCSRLKAVDWEILTEIGERANAERRIGEETPWGRLFDMVFQPSYREVVVEFLSTFTYRPGGVLEIVFSMLRQRHEMPLVEFAEPDTVTPLYTAGITEIDDATLRAWWPHIAEDQGDHKRPRRESVASATLSFDICTR
ncbi:hypothetical protein R6Q57_013302 [Mikania cordata]